MSSYNFTLGSPCYIVRSPKLHCLTGAPAAQRTEPVLTTRLQAEFDLLQLLRILAALDEALAAALDWMEPLLHDAQCISSGLYIASGVVSTSTA
eukprot:scaffold76093_cov19-Tisochrysis_lutea.AAC.1